MAMTHTLFDLALLFVQTEASDSSCSHTDTDANDENFEITEWCTLTIICSSPRQTVGHRDVGRLRVFE